MLIKHITVDLKKRLKKGTYETLFDQFFVFQKGSYLRQTVGRLSPRIIVSMIVKSIWSILLSSSSSVVWVSGSNIFIIYNLE